jgi:hypothetical protein
VLPPVLLPQFEWFSRRYWNWRAARWLVGTRLWQGASSAQSARSWLPEKKYSAGPVQSSSPNRRTIKRASAALTAEVSVWLTSNVFGVRESAASIINPRMDPAIDSAEVTLALSGVLRLARSRLDDFTAVRSATDGFVGACFLPDIRGVPNQWPSGRSYREAQRTTPQQSHNPRNPVN